jgi:formylmethanofuran dehydrogenase subunit B
MTAAASAADLDRAAATLAAARRVLLSGLVDAPTEAAMAACDVAEAVGGMVDTGCPETSRTIGPLLARIGLVTADTAELRDRADLVVFWFCDPGAVPAELVAASAAPRPGDAARRTIAVGPRDVSVPVTGHRHLALAADAAVDLARLVEATIRDVSIDERATDASVFAAARNLAAEALAATTVALVTDWRHDHVGLAAWSTASLVRALAHRKPAFEVPLGERTDAAIDVCTWRFGAAGAIERAERAGGRFLPAEADAVRLIDRREIDCVMVAGAATPEVEAAVARAAGHVVVVRLPADAATLRQVAARIGTRRGFAP